jgi:hypothetical protein
MTVMNQRFDGTQTQLKSSIDSSKEDLSVKITDGMEALQNMMEQLKMQLEN